MTDDLQQARIEAAAKALREMRNFDEGVSSVLLESWSLMVAEVALAAADAHLPSVEQIAEVVAKANYDWSQQRLEFWRRPASVESPGDLDQYIARAVRSLFGEVAGDAPHAQSTTGQ